MLQNLEWNKTFSLPFKIIRDTKIVPSKNKSYNIRDKQFII